MKQLTSCLGLCFILLSCRPKKLTNESAEELILKESQTVLNAKIPVTDREFVQRGVNASLDKDGWITIDQQPILISKRIIHFTEKSKPYLLPISAEDLKSHLHPVKLADKEFIEVTAIRLKDNGTSAIVEFTTRLTNPTPLMGFFPELH